MALPEIKRAEAERDLKKFCAEFVPPAYRDQIRHTYKIRGNDITLIEERPPWDGIGTEWTKLPIARFRYEPDCNGWSVSWQRANGRWALLRLDRRKCPFRRNTRASRAQ